MARHEHTPEKFESIAEELIQAANSLKVMAASMRDADLSHALVHGTLSQKTHLPAIIEWVDKTCVDVKSQIRAKKEGVPSNAELHILKNENAKLAAAKKPFTPQGVKKKTP